MKATFDIPDEIYRQAKARSALEGRPLRAVVIEHFERWLSLDLPGEEQEPAEPATGTRFDTAPWTKLVSSRIQPDADHDLDRMRESIARGWAAETSESS